MGRVVRLVVFVGAAALGTLAHGCAEQAPAAPEVVAISPAVGSASSATAITVTGSFELVIKVSYRSAQRSAIDTAFTTRIGGVNAETTTYVDSTTLHATVPAGLPIGRHDVLVRSPAGLTHTLFDAFEVRDTSPTTCSTDAQCTDSCYGGGACTNGTCVYGVATKDTDGDTYVDATCPGGDDCDDDCATCHPGGTESCDGADNDCDPMTQDGSDEATFGNACDGVDADACTDGSIICDGTALVCDDPNDNHVETVADGVDQDCDGVDLCYVDGDGDSYGSALTVIDTDLDCANASNGEAANADDCDDGAPTVFPGTPCDDGDSCTTGEMCTAAVCAGGTNTCCGGSCGGTCDASGCCDELCSGGNCPDCAAGCVCDLTCTGGDCDSGCRNGSTCQVTATNFSDLESDCWNADCTFDCANSSGRCRLDCSGSADCELTCNNVDECRMDCDDNSVCLLRCNDADTCTFNGCPSSDRNNCGGGVWTCRQPCP